MKLGLALAAVVLLRAAVTVTVAEKSTLYFVSFLPYSDPRPTFQSTWEDAEEIVPSGYLALEQINNRTDILKDYTIELIEKDGGCNIATRTVVGIAKSGILDSSKPIVGIIGPSCTDSAVTVGSLTSREEVALISVHYGTYPLLGNRTEYPYAFGTLGSHGLYVGGVIGLVQDRQWKKVVILYTDGDLELREVFRSTERGINNLTDYEIAFSSAISQTYLPLREIQDAYAPVIIVFAPVEITNMLLCMAHQEGLRYPTYQWVFIDRVLLDFEDTEFFYDSKYYNCSKSQISVSANAGVSFIFALRSSKDANGTLSRLSYEDYYHSYTEKAKEQNVDPTVWASPFYDSVWALALALNASLEDLRVMNFSLTKYGSGNPDITKIIARHMYELDFEGISGRINFDRETGFSSRTLLVTQFFDGDTRQAGFYGSGNFVIYSNYQDFVRGQFETRYEYVAVPVGIVFLIIIMITLPLTILAQIMNVIKSDYKTIKASSPRINHLAFVGYYLVVFSIILHTTTVTFMLTESVQSTLCNMVPWSLSIGLSLLLGTLCLKTWRIYHIFLVAVNSKKGMLIHKDCFLILIILLQLPVDILVCTLWSTIDPFTVEETQPRFINEDGIPVIIQRKVCRSQYVYTWIGLLTGHKALILLLALSFALLARKVQWKGFETRNVAILVYVLSIVGGLGIPLYLTTYILQLNVISFSILCSVLDALLYLYLFLLFLTPLYPWMREKYKMCYSVQSKVDSTPSDIQVYTSADIRRYSSTNVCKYTSTSIQTPYTSTTPYCTSTTPYTSTPHTSTTPYTSTTLYTSTTPYTSTAQHISIAHIQTYKSTFV